MRRSSKKFPKLHFYVLLVLTLTQPVFARKLINKTVVLVNNDIVLESDILKFQRKLKSKSFQELFGGVDEKIANDRNSVIQLLVEEKLINQQVKKNDLSASEQEINGQIRSILNRNGITKNQLQIRLQQLGTTLSEYRDSIKRQIERRNLIDREIKPNLKISDDQLRHFFARQSGSTSGQIQYKIAHILVSNGDNAEKRSMQIWKEVSKKPTQFAQAAKDYSDDPGSRESGGTLGYLSLEELSKEFRSVIPNTKLNSITKPIKTAAGYHIVKVLDKQRKGFESLSKQQKETLRNQMFASELERRMMLWLQRKKKEAYIKFSS